jgi:hypothetical protein
MDLTACLCDEDAVNRTSPTSDDVVPPRNLDETPANATSRATVRKKSKVQGTSAVQVSYYSVASSGGTMGPW